MAERKVPRFVVWRSDVTSSDDLKIAKKYGLRPGDQLEVLERTTVSGKSPSGEPRSWEGFRVRLPTGEVVVVSDVLVPRAAWKPTGEARTPGPGVRAFDRPHLVLKANRKNAIDFATKTSVSHVEKLLRRAQHDLDRRLRETVRAGPGKDSFTATQIQSTLRQVELVLRDLKRGMHDSLMDSAREAAETTAAGTLKYFESANARYLGVVQRLPLKEASVLDRAVSGAQSSVLHRLEGDPKAGPGILDRYGDNVVSKFEDTLQQRFIQRMPWEEVKANLVADSPFLQGAPASWAERIARTETMAATNQASMETIQATDEALGDVVKILSSVFDARTGADSIAVHGQIRRTAEAFNTWFGAVMHPPDRPNDRGIVVPHRLAWPIPAELTWRGMAEVIARWHYEGRKGSPPERPRMTTVDLKLFAKPGA